MATGQWRRIWDTSADSAQLARCSLDAHLAFPHMAYVVDVYGRCYATPDFIRGKMLRVRCDVPDKTVHRWLAEWSREGLITVYAFGGLPLLQVVNHDRYQPEDVRYREERGIPERLPPPAGYVPAEPIRKRRSDRGANRKIADKYPISTDYLSDSETVNTAKIADKYPLEDRYLPSRARGNDNDKNNDKDKDNDKACKASGASSLSALQEQPGQQASGCGEQRFDVNESHVAARFQQVFPTETQRESGREQFMLLLQRHGDARMLEALGECELARARDGAVGLGLLKKILRDISVRETASCERTAVAQPVGDVSSASVVAALISAGLGGGIARKLAAAHPEQAIRDQIAWLPMRETQNPVAALVTAIRDGWEPPEQVIAERKQEARRRRERAEGAQREQAAATYEARTQRIDGWIAALSDGERSALEAEAEGATGAAAVIPLQARIRILAARRMGLAPEDAP